MEIRDKFKFTMSPEFFEDSTTVFTAKLMDNGEYLVTWGDNQKTTYEPKYLIGYLENGFIREAGEHHS